MMVLPDRNRHLCVDPINSSDAVQPSYENMLEACYREALRQGDSVIDVGAHNGRHSLPSATAVGSQGRVFGFEPLPLQHQQLSALIAADRPQVRLWRRSHCSAVRCLADKLPL